MLNYFKPVLLLSRKQTQHTLEHLKHKLIRSERQKQKRVSQLKLNLPACQNSTICESAIYFLTATQVFLYGHFLIEYQNITSVNPIKLRKL